MLSAITFTTGILLITGICNDTATLTQITICAMIGFTLMLLSLLFSKHYCYRLEFITPKGNRKIICTNNLARKLLITHKYTKAGYHLAKELEIERN